MIMNYDNKQYRMHALGAVHSGDDHEIFSVGLSQDDVSRHSRFEEIDYESIRNKITEAEQDGHNMEALRLKIQWEARQLLESQQVASTEVRKIVHRHVRKERDWRDHIRLNHFRIVDSVKV